MIRNEPQEFFAFAIFLSLDLLITSTQTEHVPKQGRCWHGRSVWVASDWCNLWNLQIADIKCLSRINIPLMNSCLEQHTFSNGLYCHKRGGLAVKLFSNATHTHTTAMFYWRRKKDRNEDTVYVLNILYIHVSRILLQYLHRLHLKALRRTETENSPVPSTQSLSIKMRLSCRSPTFRHDHCSLAHIEPKP